MSDIIQPKNHRGLTYWLAQKIEQLPESALASMTVATEARRESVYDQCLAEIATMEMMLPGDSLNTMHGLAAIRETMEAYDEEHGPHFVTLLTLDDHVEWTKGGALLDQISAYAVQAKEDWANKKTYKIMAILPIPLKSELEGSASYYFWARWISQGPVSWAAESRLFEAAFAEAIKDADAIVLSNELYLAMATVLYEISMAVRNTPLQPNLPLREIAEALGGSIREDMPIIIVSADENLVGYEEFATSLLDSTVGPFYDHEYQFNDARNSRPFASYPPFQPRNYHHGSAIRNILVH